MNVAPRLLNYNNVTQLPSLLFSDLNLDKLLSAKAINVLQNPCSKSEIERRNELFALLDNEENFLLVQNSLTALSRAQKAFDLISSAKTAIDRYYRSTEAFECYITACEMLASMTSMGDLFKSVADHYASVRIKTLLEDMKQTVKRLRNLLEHIRTGLLTFSNKNWLTPDYEAVSEYDNILISAKKLGFKAPNREDADIKLNNSLSDAICSLFTNEVAQIEAEISNYNISELSGLTVYINEIKFYLEIRALVLKADKLGVSHCFAKISDSPCFSAKDLYNVSLLAKNCENIIPNDADFSQTEAFFFLVGANGGGKTTYLQAVGTNLIFFLAGCPVFAKSADIYPFEIVLSHFPKDERFDNSGRLGEEKTRAGDMLRAAHNKSAFFLFNETFSGADDTIGFDLLTEAAEKIKENNYFGLYVTHFHQVMSLDFPVLSAEVDLHNENRRTFRIKKTKGRSSSYAADILKKYGLDKESLERRRHENGN